MKGGRLEAFNTKSEFWMNDDLQLFALLPKASPVPVTVCLGGNVLLPSKLHWGNLKTGVAQQQRPRESTRGAERRRRGEGGREARGNAAQQQHRRVSKAAASRSPPPGGAANR